MRLARSSPGRTGVWLAAALASLAAPAPAGAAPSAGRYDAQLCVATRPGAEPSCGAAEADVRSPTRLDVRVADVVFRLALRSSQLDVSTLHGRLQVDEFSSAYSWDHEGGGDVLRFGDEAKGRALRGQAGSAPPAVALR